jgi:bifunctional non-homologous end joining protein LigD
LDSMATRSPAVRLKGKNLVFADPGLVVEVEFRGWSQDGKLRHASYKGVRDAQDQAAVYQASDRDT